MKRAKKTESSEAMSLKRPALSPEVRENQLIALAVDLVEQRLRDGTASAAETTHFLKLASTKAKYENELMGKQLELMQAKTEALKSSARMEEMYKEAMNAFKRYSGHANDEVEY